MLLNVLYQNTVNLISWAMVMHLRVVAIMSRLSRVRSAQSYVYTSCEDSCTNWPFLESRRPRESAGVLHELRPFPDVC